MNIGKYLIVRADILPECPQHDHGHHSGQEQCDHKRVDDGKVVNLVLRFDDREGERRLVLGGGGPSSRSSVAGQVHKGLRKLSYQGVERLVPPSPRRQQVQIIGRQISAFGVLNKEETFKYQIRVHVSCWISVFVSGGSSGFREHANRQRKFSPSDAGYCCVLKGREGVVEIG